MESSLITALIGIFVLFIYVNSAMADIENLPPCNWAGLYNFGDSNSDTGGIFATFTPVKSPNGFMYFVTPAGRLSDGLLIIDFLAEYIGLPYLSAYLDMINTEYRHGANFAAGESTIRRQNETIFKAGISPFSLDVQVVQFTQFKSRIIDLWRTRQADKSRLPRRGHFSKSLFTIDIGQNDLSVGFRTLTEQQLLAAIPDIINKFATSVKHLYAQGARSFLIHNTGPIGCLPVEKSKVQNPKPGDLDLFGCIKYQNDMAIEFNRQLKDRVSMLRSELTKAAITYVDTYTAKYKLIINAKEHGFKDPFKVCCGKFEKNVHISCGSKGIVNGSTVRANPCWDPYEYVIWDGVHLTEVANRLVANQILNGSLSNPPIPATHACYKHL